MPKFLNDPGIWQCNVDKLSYVLPEIVAWVAKVIRSCPHDDRVETAVKWMCIDNFMESPTLPK